MGYTYILQQLEDTEKKSADQEALEEQKADLQANLRLYLAALALLLLVEPHRFYNRKNPWLLRLAWGMGVAVLVLLGCVLEASVGIRLLRFVVEKL